MITTMFFILVPFLKRAPCIIIHLARNAEKGGGVLMSIILPNLNHSFVPVPFPDSGFPGFPYAPLLTVTVTHFSIEIYGTMTLICTGIIQMGNLMRWLFFNIEMMLWLKKTSVISSGINSHR